MVDYAFAPFLRSTPPLSSSPPPPNRLCGRPGASSLSSRLAVKVSLSVSSSLSTGRSCSYFSDHRASYRYDSLHLSACIANAAAGGKAPISSLTARSSLSERVMNGGQEALASLATTDHDKLLASENDGDDNGKSPPVDESKVLTLPTILTLGRMAAIPILLIAFYSTEWWASKAVAFIFLLAAITDWLDGFLARKMGSNSTFGAFLDPVADKLMVSTTLVLLSTKPLHISWAASLPWLIPLPSTAIIGREITMSAVREWAASQGENLQAAVAVNKLGKWKTAFQMVALTVLLACRDGRESTMVYILVPVGVGLLYISAALAIWSLFVYMKAIWGALVR